MESAIIKVRSMPLTMSAADRGYAPMIRASPVKSSRKDTIIALIKQIERTFA
jgi:hypothetical protein